MSAFQAESRQEKKRARGPAPAASPAPAAAPAPAPVQRSESSPKGPMEPFRSTAPVHALGGPVQERGDDGPIADEPPVQAKCAACEAEERANAGAPPVQLWDCSEYGKPTCVQSKEDESAPPMIQTKCAECEAEERARRTGERTPRAIRREARRGLADSGQPLPHGEAIQQAFGRHDVSGVRAHVGGTARDANRRMGALAFTSGSRIGFRDSPSLRLAAHEAAHVVQQRTGLSLPGGVGRSGDRWERHADRVADEVVAGRSAEPLLDEVVGGRSAAKESDEPGAGKPGEAVQHQITSLATRVMEPAPPIPTVAPAEPEGGAAAGGGEESAAGTAEGETAEDGSALEAAEADGDAEPPPEGVTEGAAPAGGGTVAATASTGAPASGGATAAAPAPASAPASASAPANAPAAPSTEPGAPATEAGRPAETRRGAPQGPCYNVDPPPPPSDAPEPQNDERGGEPQEQPQVTFEAWPPDVEECPAEEAVAGAAQQAPGGMGGGPAAAGAGAPGAGEGAPAAGAETSSAAVAAPGAAPAAEGGGAATAEGGGAAGGEPAAAGGAGGAGEGPAAAKDDGGGTAGAVGAAEAARDAAITDYLGSTDEIGSAVSRSRSLGPGVSLPAAEGAGAVAARRDASDTLQAFLDRAAGQIAAAADFARDEVPTRLGGMAESVKASVAGAVESEKAAISGRMAQARASARAGAAAARAHVRAAYAESAARIESSTLAALAALDTEHTTSVDAVDEKETAGLADVDSRFAAGRTSHEAKGPEYAGRAIARGQEHADSYERCKGDYSDDGFWDGCLTVRRARAQQDSACKTAAGYKDVFLRTANKKGYDLKELRKQYRCAVISGARQVHRTLDDTHDRLVSGLESGRTGAMGGIALARDENLAAIDKALVATLKSLTEQEHDQRQAVDDAGYLKQLALEQMAHAGAAGLARGIGAAMGSLERTLAALRDRFSRGELPDPATLAGMLETAETSLGGGMGTLLETMEEGAQQTEARIEALGVSSLEALSAITTSNDEMAASAESGFAEQMDGLKQGASRAFAQLTDKHVEKALQAQTDGVASLQQAVAGFDTALATIGGKVDAAIASSLQELDQDLSTKLGELDGQIAREAWKAAEKEQPAWKSVVAIVLIIVVIIAAAVISIVTLGAGASLFAVILVGALVGAVSGGLIQLINNWASGEEWHTGLVQAMVMGAIGGAIGGGLGFAGGALSAGAAAAGARAVTQLAITVGADLVSEGITQTIGYFAFGQQFNWQGFVMAGAMSGVSFRAHPSAPRGGAAGAPAPHAPAPRAPGASGGRAAAVQIAGGAAVGMGIELAGAAITGKKLDLTQAASAAASGAVGARTSRMGAQGGPAPPRREPTTRLGRAAERVRTFDPGGVGERLGQRLEAAGGRAFGARPDVGAPAAARPRTDEPTARPADEPTAAPTRPVDEPSAAPTRPVDEPSAAPSRPVDEPDTRAPRPVDEPGAAPSRRPAADDAAPDLHAPANRIPEQELIEATTTRAKVGDTDHDFRMSRECEVCTACDPTKRQLRSMIDTLEDGPLRTDLRKLAKLVDDVETRLAQGHSGVKMIEDTAAIARGFRELGAQHPTLGRALENPRLIRTETPGAQPELSPHLRDLPADVTLTRTIAPSDWRSIPMAPGDQAIYILRDVETGAVLKVGIAENHLERFGQYANAGNKLDRNLQLDVAIVQPKGGRTIRDVESDLRTRVSDEGHVLPWDNTKGRLGRSDRGTPFVHPVSPDLMWDRHGHLVTKGTGEPPPPVRRAASSPEEMADFLHQGMTTREIADLKGVEQSTVRSWKTRWKSRIAEATRQISEAENITNQSDG